MDTKIPHAPVPAPANPGTVRDRLESLERQITDVRTELAEVKAELHFALRLLSIDPGDFDFPGGTR